MAMLFTMLESSLTRLVVVGHGAAVLLNALDQFAFSAPRFTARSTHLGVNGTSRVVGRSLLDVIFRHGK
jgi:hypothetical protein